MSESAPQVFTVEEITLAARVPREAVDAVLAAGEVRAIPGVRFFTAGDAIALGRLARRVPAQVAAAPADLFAGAARPIVRERRAVPAFFSSAAHVMLLLLIMGLTAGRTDTAAIEQSSEPTRLVFLVQPGPGGGGGGGGLKNPLPPARVKRQGLEHRVSVPVVAPKPEVTTVRREVEVEKPPVVPTIQPQPVEREPEPAPPIAAPVAPAKADPQEQQGVIDNGRAESPSQGSGTGGGAGSGQGSGNGEGLGSGIGDGSGGGTGGGPYRPGSGIEPPRLVREVKAEYTEDARHRGLSGDVVLEIVVRRDGSVGDVKILRGLGAGLDQRAVEAVRQWRFDPARRKGTPVDVIVEVAVEFTLR